MEEWMLFKAIMGAAPAPFLYLIPNKYENVRR